MQISTRKHGNVVILDMSGKMTTGESTRLLAATFKELLDQGETRFVFNMLNIPWLDSGAIGEVVACQRRVMRKKAVIRVVLQGRAHDLFTMMSLDKVFKIFEAVEEALASLAEWRPEQAVEIGDPDEKEAEVLRD